MTYQDWLRHRRELARSVAETLEERGELIEAAYHKGLAMGLAQALQEYMRQHPDTQ